MKPLAKLSVVGTVVAVLSGAAVVAASRADAATTRYEVESAPASCAGMWRSWATGMVTVQLNAGTNSVRLAATTAGGLANVPNQRRHVQ